MKAEWELAAAELIDYAVIELGVLRGVNDLWVQIFDNRGRTVREEGAVVLPS